MRAFPAGCRTSVENTLTGAEVEIGRGKLRRAVLNGDETICVARQAGGRPGLGELDGRVVSDCFGVDLQSRERREIIGARYLPRIDAEPHRRELVARIDYRLPIVGPLDT